MYEVVVLPGISLPWGKKGGGVRGDPPASDPEGAPKASKASQLFWDFLRKTLGVECFFQ